MVNFLGVSHFEIFHFENSHFSNPILQKSQFANYHFAKITHFELPVHCPSRVTRGTDSERVIKRNLPFAKIPIRKLLFRNYPNSQQIICLNPLVSPCAGDPALKYGYVNIVTSSPGEVKGLNNLYFLYSLMFLFNTRP